MSTKPTPHQKPTHCYKGICRGCYAVLASAYDMTDDPKGTAEAVADMIRSGLTIAHELFPGSPLGTCICPKPERQEQLL